MRGPCTWASGSTIFTNFISPPRQRTTLTPLLCGLQNRFILTESSHKEALCHEMARILTRFYNPLTFEQIRSLAPCGGGLYDTGDGRFPFCQAYYGTGLPPFHDRPFRDNTRIRIRRIALFFLHLSIQMRLDRSTEPEIWSGPVTGPSSAPSTVFLRRYWRNRIPICCRRR